MVDVYVMVGVPGCGKSTWIEHNKDPFSTVISRDEIRFDMLKSGDDYFKYEIEVFNEYVKRINNHINNNHHINKIYCDATQINEKSRNKLLDRLDLNNDNDVNINIVYIKTSLDVILDRNSKREGISRVPDDAILDIFNNRLSEPTFDEKYKYKEIRIINGDLLDF